jgi:hypothetical protein
MQPDDHLYDNVKPTLSDLEDQLARNEAYNLELEHAYETLWLQSYYWLAAAFTCLLIASVLGFVALTPIEQGVLQTYTGQTIVTTMLALALSAEAACFSHFTTLRRLAGEAFRVNRANKFAIVDARELLDRCA